MREHAGQRAAGREVGAGLPALVAAAEEEDATDYGPLQRPPAGPPGERPQVLRGGGAGGHESAGGGTGQGDLPVPHLQTLPGRGH